MADIIESWNGNNPSVTTSPVIETNSMRIKLLGYFKHNDENRRDNDMDEHNIITDGLNFHYNNNFLVISNKAIPKDSKVYIEVEVSNYTFTNEIRHIPLMIGIHKEPSFGILNSDCCLAALYYTKNSWYVGPNSSSYLGFRVIEKFAGYPIVTRYVTDLKKDENGKVGKIALKNSIIGLGINMKKNILTIFTDGVELYSFSPQNFHLFNDGANFYFALYSSESMKNIEGFVKFGQYGTTYMPSGYSSLYQELFLRKDVKFSIPARVYTGYKYFNHEYIRDFFDYCKVRVENDVAPVNMDEHRRDIELSLYKNDMIVYINQEQNIINKHSFHFTPHYDYQDYAYVKQPVDKFRKLYCEITCKYATLISDYTGVPIAIGVTKSPDDLSKCSLKINLYHLNTDGYHVIREEDGVEYVGGNYSIENPVYPTQPNIIGVLLDLLNNTIEIYTEGILFTRIVSTDIDFSKAEDPVFLFVEAAPLGIFTGTGFVYCNFGTQETDDISFKDDELAYKDLLSMNDIISYWKYYNSNITEPYYNGVDRICDLECSIKIISEFLTYSKNIYARIVVPETMELTNGFDKGLNKLWHTYNKIEDLDEHVNVPDKSVYDIRRLIDEDKENNRR